MIAASRRLLFLAAAAALVAGLGVGTVRHAEPVFADGGDGDDGEGGEGGGGGGGEGEEGAEEPETPDAEGGEAPTLENPLEIVDTRGYVSVQVPRSWKIPEGVEMKGTLVGIYAGPITAKVSGHVELHVETRYSRATLALGSHVAQLGSAVAGEERKGPGWSEGAFTFQRRNWKLVSWERDIEKDGAVYVVRFVTLARAKDDAKEIVRKMLDTAAVKKTAPPPSPSGELTAKKQGPFDVWTDSDDKGAVGKIVDWADEARGAAQKALKGKPFDESRPVLKPYKVGALYLQAMEPAYGSGPDYAAFDPLTRSVGVQAYRIDHDDAPPAIRSAAARQYVAQYFGGDTPIWIDLGLARYAMVVADSGGKPDKPQQKYLAEARDQVVNKSRPLTYWIELSGSGGSLDAKTDVPELWAWHYFLRSGSKKWAKPYQGYIDALRQTGDLNEAKKAFEGVDFEMMQREFKDFALKWKL